MKNKLNPGGSLRGFSGAFTDPRTGNQISYSTLRDRNAAAVLATRTDVVAGPFNEVFTWVDAGGVERRRELLSVTTVAGRNIVYEPIHDSDVTSPQRVCDRAAITRRLAERSTASLETFTDSIVRRGEAIANADELLAAGRIKPTAAEIWTARIVVRDAGGAMTIGALNQEGFSRRLIMSLVHHRHLAAERGRRFATDTIISLTH